MRFLLTLGLSALTALPAAAQDVALKPGKLIVSADQKPLTGQTILIQKGKVVAVGAKVTIPKGVTVLERPNAWVVPGFVDSETTLSLEGDNDETTDPLAVDVRVSSRIDPDHRDFAAARRAGITTCLVTPGSSNLFGGQAALLKSTGVEMSNARPIAKIALGPSMLRSNRPPTSRTGALALLRDTLAEEHTKKQGGLLARFAKGEAPTIAAASSPADLSALLRFKTQYGLQLIFRPGTLLPRHLAVINLAGHPVALGPFTSRTDALTLKTASALAAAKAKVILVSGQPMQPPVALRLSAVLAARNGLDPKLALRAITQTPAEALGIGDRVGQLSKGFDGDLVVLDGPPLQLSARVLEVFVDGKRVYRRPGKAKN